VSPNLEHHLTTAEVAALLGVSSRTVDRLRAAGDLPPILKGRRPNVYYDERDVLAYLARIRAPYTTPKATA
jgi:excisionase family DNA binding protein